MTFPNYNPNPEDLEMLHAISAAVKASGADIGLGFDGDGDRCGVIDNDGRGDLRRQGRRHARPRPVGAYIPRAVFVVDVKSTGLYATDPVLKAQWRATDYWKTGHSYIKRRVHELNALAGFEKSGHYFFNRADRPRLRRRPGLGDRHPRHARPQSGQVDGRPEGRPAEDLGLADHVGALPGRDQIRRRRRRPRALRRDAGRGRDGRRPCHRRPRHRQRRPRRRPTTAPGAWSGPRPTSRNWWSWSRARSRSRACGRCSMRSTRCSARTTRSVHIIRRSEKARSANLAELALALFPIRDNV